MDFGRIVNLPYLRYEAVTKSQAVNYLNGYLEKFTASSDMNRILSYSEDFVALYRHLDFDSRIYNMPMGLLELYFSQDVTESDFALAMENFKSVCEEYSIRHATVKVSAENTKVINMLERFGVRSIVTTMHFRLKVKLKKQGIFSSDIYVRPFLQDDYSDLKRINSKAFAQGTRFHLDETLPYEQSCMLYDEWFDNSCKGIAANRIFVACSPSNRPIGFMTLEKDAIAEEYFQLKLANIGLLAVARNEQGRGGGRKLCDEGIAWLKGEGYDYLTVATENINYRAVNFYMKYGFYFDNAIAILHWCKK